VCDGTLDNTPTENTHLTLGEFVYVPLKEVEDIWIEGEVPESVKRLLETKEEELKAEKSFGHLFERALQHSETGKGYSNTKSKTSSVASTSL
jgi:hypothetical protein